MSKSRSSHVETLPDDNCNDAISVSSSATYMLKTAASFDNSVATLEGKVDDGFEEQEYNPRRRSSWKGMPRRWRRKSRIDMGIYNDDLDEEELLADKYPITVPNSRRKRNWCTFCMFGGIGALSILAILLMINIFLSIMTHLWYSEIDSTLQNWGKPGTKTEGLSWYPTDFTRDILPIPCHSHNDYWRQVPLFSALRAGCIGVEADVWLFDNEIYVGHNTGSLTRNRTFASLYVNPLAKILHDQNKKTDFYNGTDHGVFDVDPEQTLTLLVDVKTPGKETWPSVLAQLDPLRERGWLSFVENDQLHVRAVTVVGTGNTPFDLITVNATYRDAFFDAPLETMWESTEDMNRAQQETQVKSTSENLPAISISRPVINSGSTPGTEFSYLNSHYASVSLRKAVGHVWGSGLTIQQVQTIRGQVAGAHRRGLKARYWDLPSWPLDLRNRVWDVLVQEGVDLLNVDDLRGASQVVW